MILKPSALSPNKRWRQCSWGTPQQIPYLLSLPVTTSFRSGMSTPTTWRDLPDTNCLLSCWRCPWSSSCLKNSKVTRDIHLPKLYETYIQIIQHFIDLKHPDITECSLQLGKLVFWNHPMSALHLLWGRVRSILHRPCAFICLYISSKMFKVISGHHHPSGNVARKASRWRWRSASKHRMEWSSRWRAERSS